MNHSNDGFEIANEDLRLRGPGEIFGTLQSGELRFKSANLYRDAEMIPKIRELADYFISKLQNEDTEKYRALNEALTRLSDEITA